MDEKLILEKIRHVRQRLNIQRYFQTFARFLFYGFLGCVPIALVDSFTAFNVPPRVFLWMVIGIAVIAMVKSLIRPVSLYRGSADD